MTSFPEGLRDPTQSINIYKSLSLPTSDFLLFPNPADDVFLIEKSTVAQPGFKNFADKGKNELQPTCHRLGLNMPPRSHLTKRSKGLRRGYRQTDYT